MLMGLVTVSVQGVRYNQPDVKGISNSVCSGIRGFATISLMLKGLFNYLFDLCLIVCVINI